LSRTSPHLVGPPSLPSALNRPDPDPSTLRDPHPLDLDLSIKNHRLAFLAWSP
jgi:hypothetical protein